ncbi:MAG: lasso RiPP family leader peptide-containing protein [Anaerolineales bacterium]|nr:lasso RiPP family leader peptide-containing protein [Anaerolineales bacterium]
MDDIVQKTAPPAEPPAPGKRPYTPPRLTVHGDVQSLTGKIGQDPDLDGGGSFLPA